MTRPRVREDWRELVEQFRGQGGTVAGFARQVGVNSETFRKWVRKLERAKAASTQSKALTFVEVELPQAPTCQALGPVEVRVGGDVLVRLDRLPPAAWLAELARC